MYCGMLGSILYGTTRNVTFSSETFSGNKPIQKQNSYNQSNNTDASFLIPTKGAVMSKKTILALVLCLVALGCAYAGNSSIVAQVSPYSLQTVSASEGLHVSTYGYGAKVGYRYEVWNGLSVGADVDFSTFKFKEIDSGYNILSARALVGCTYRFSDKVFAQAELGFSMEFRSTAHAKGSSVGFNLYLGGGYSFNHTVALTGGVDVGMGFQKGIDGVAPGFELRTRIGALVTL